MLSVFSTRLRTLFLLLLLQTSLMGLAQQEIALYNGTIPNSTNATNEEYTRISNDGERVIYKVSVPTLTLFLPPANKSNGTAVIVCPGGGYRVEVSKREGSDIARKFNELGIAAFVLKYRLPADRTMQDKSIGPLQDAQRAIQMIRENAAEWKINADKIGIMGFSAGGHLAATAGTRFREVFIDNPSGTSLRPDFMLLIYPVISLADSVGHSGTRRNLLGDNPSPVKVRAFSNELQVSQFTPPAFLTHAADDSVVPVENSLLFFSALRKNRVPSGLFIYPKGEHGYLSAPPFDEWFERCIYWMKQMTLIP